MTSDLKELLERHRKNDASDAVIAKDYRHLLYDCLLRAKDREEENLDETPDEKPDEKPDDEQAEPPSFYSLATFAHEQGWLKSEDNYSNLKVIDEITSIFDEPVNRARWPVILFETEDIKALCARLIFKSQTASRDSRLRLLTRSRKWPWI